jgi:SAM-dependent methyltransferase
MMRSLDFQKLSETIVASIPGSPKGLRDYMVYNAPRIKADHAFITERVAKDASILDIGAVPPFLAAALKESGYDTITIGDPKASSFADFCEARGIKYRDVNLLDAIPGEFLRAFDLVIFNEVTEHLTGDVLGALKRVASCLKPGGHLMVTTPNLRSLSGLFALVFARSGLASKPFETVAAQYLRVSGDDAYFGHVREYTARELVQLFQGLGMEHVDSSFQANYTVVPGSYRERFDPFWKRRKRYMLFRVGYCFAARLEALVPAWRLFGKHLFRAPEA